jgi:hypothetical protein
MGKVMKEKQGLEQKNEARRAEMSRTEQNPEENQPRYLRWSGIGVDVDVKAQVNNQPLAA